MIVITHEAYGMKSDSIAGTASFQNPINQRVHSGGGREKEAALDASTCDKDSRPFVWLVTERAGHDRLQAKLYLVPIGLSFTVLQKKVVWHLFCLFWPRGGQIGFEKLSSGED